MAEPLFLSATRVAYDIVAVDYARLLEAEVPETALDLAVLEVFATAVRDEGGGTVADVGCGPGRITARLHALGVSAFGVDLSPAMVDTARRAYPELRFDVGSMMALELPDESVGGVVAWYSIIHTPPELLATVFAEFRRVLAPGGRLLLAFQAGNERRHIEQGYGHNISLDAYRLPPDEIAGLLRQAGLLVDARIVREPEGREKVPQARLLAHKPAEPHLTSITGDWQAGYRRFTAEEPDGARAETAATNVGGERRRRPASD